MEMTPESYSLCMGVSDIGRKSESTSRAGEDFAAGIDNLQISTGMEHNHHE
jgi:hypothetical protein